MTDNYTWLYALRCCTDDHEIVLLDYAWAAEHFPLVAQLEEAAGVGDRSMRLPFTARTLREALHCVYVQEQHERSGFGVYGLSADARDLLGMLQYDLNSYAGTSLAWIAEHALYISAFTGFSDYHRPGNVPESAVPIASKLINYSSRLFGKGGYAVSLAPSELSFNETTRVLRRPADALLVAFDRQVVSTVSRDIDGAQHALLRIAADDLRTSCSSTGPNKSVHIVYTLYEIRPGVDLHLADNLPLAALMCFAYVRPVEC